MVELVADLDKNQRLLIEGFALARDANTEVVIMDGHVVIDDGECLTEISSEQENLWFFHKFSMLNKSRFLFSLL